MAAWEDYLTKCGGRIFGVIYDIRFRHQATHYVGCQHGHCRWSSSGGCVGICMLTCILTLSHMSDTWSQLGHLKSCMTIRFSELEATSKMGCHPCHCRWHLIFLRGLWRYSCVNTLLYPWGYQMPRRRLSFWHLLPRFTNFRSICCYLAQTVHSKLTQ